VTGLVLAAGVGKRLAPLTEDRPKGLIELGGRSLLARLLDGLQAAGVEETILVVGHREAMIRGALGSSHHGMPLRYLVNPRYAEGPQLSLWAGRAAFERDDVVLADGDVLFAPPLLERVVRAPEPNVYLASLGFVDTGEEMLLYVRQGRVEAIRRGVIGPPPTAFETRAEWVGFVKVGRAAGADLARILDDMVRDGRVEGDYEVALDVLLPRHVFAACWTDGLPWIEIDFPQDLQAAESEVLPRIEGRPRP
jgi:L-glutamine-phosphate cytidylyltransferase